ncbi:MAG TPA: YraN family protein [Steroidobacteraceae bacterium]|jgi:putative endonuclease|nr:YraN family protein [Steroidobacteraceae bacterium]
MLTARQQSGRRAEELAADFLRARGCEILHCNYRRRLGELDIVARADGVLIIVEVRTRASRAYGGAAASVDHRKQRRIMRAAQQLLQQRSDLTVLPVRFDVIVVNDPHGSAPAIEWIQHAFEAC